MNVVMSLWSAQGQPYFTVLKRMLVYNLRICQSLYMIKHVVTSSESIRVLHRYTFSVGDINCFSSTPLLQRGSEISEPG